MKFLRILYICNEDRATTKQRLMALKELPVQMDVVYTSILDEAVSFFTRVYRAALFRLGFYPERNNENRKIVSALTNNSYDVLFIEKGLSIKRQTLEIARTLQPKICIVGYSLDDMMNPHNCSRQFKNSLDLYDVYFTNKRYNVEEIKHLGAAHVVYFRNAYSKQVHRPVSISPDEMKSYGADVSFIGTYAKDRVELLRYLADQGIKIKIWGWGRSAEKSGMIHPNITMTNNYVYDDDYAKVIGASKINLCFLRKENRDTETTRSVEIPACGGFMLAERTEAHQELFEENIEAAYFTGKSELLDKIRYYLQHEDERAAIATNGLKRCIADDYSYHHQLTKILNLALGHEAIGNNYDTSNTIQRPVI